VKGHCRKEKRKTKKRDLEQSGRKRGETTTLDYHRRRLIPHRQRRTSKRSKKERASHDDEFIEERKEKKYLPGESRLSYTEKDKERPEGSSLFRRRSGGETRMIRPAGKVFRRDPRTARAENSPADEKNVIALAARAT